MYKILRLILWISGLLLVGCQQSVSPPSFPDKLTENPAACVQGDVQTQTTLWFGMTREHDRPITPQQWQQFIDQTVTPRFKDGLSVYDARGQWLNKDGVISYEPSKALMLIYHDSSRNNQSIQQIREIYKQHFAQESVMRVDNKVCVDF